MKPNQDIIFRELPPEPQKTVRAKPGSNKVHFSVYPENGVASCGNRAARYFSANWEKVNCYACLKPKLDAFNALWDKPLEALQHRKDVKQLAAVYKIQRKKGESFKDFERRVNIESQAIFRQSEAERERKRLSDLNSLNFITLPLNIKEINFPITVYELCKSNHSDDADDYSCDPFYSSEIVLDKDHYIRVLQKLRVAIDLQLQTIQKRGKKDSMVDPPTP